MANQLLQLSQLTIGRPSSVPLQRQYSSLVSESSDPFPAGVAGGSDAVDWRGGIFPQGGRERVQVT